MHMHAYVASLIHVHAYLASLIHAHAYVASLIHAHAYVASLIHPHAYVASFLRAHARPPNCMPTWPQMSALVCPCAHICENRHTCKHMHACALRREVTQYRRLSRTHRLPTQQSNSPPALLLRASYLELSPCLLRPPQPHAACSYMPRLTSPAGSAAASVHL